MTTPGEVPTPAWLARPVLDVAPELLGATLSTVVDGATVTVRLTEVEAYAGPGRQPQAHLQEFGTSHHGPQPFARPAWDRGKHDLPTGLAADFWDEIKKAADRLARKTARLAAKG